MVQHVSYKCGAVFGSLPSAAGNEFGGIWTMDNPPARMMTVAWIARSFFGTQIEPTYKRNEVEEL